MKRFCLVLLSLFMLCFLVSCTGDMDTGRGSLRVVLSQSRTISPDPSIVRIVEYELVGSNADTGAPFSHRFTGDHVTINDMEVGVWTLKVVGYNETGVAKAESDSWPVTISDGRETAQRFEVRYKGTSGGAFMTDVSVAMSETAIKGVRITVTDASTGEYCKTIDIAMENSKVIDGRRVFHMDWPMNPGRYDVEFTAVGEDGLPLGTPYYESLHIYSDAYSKIALPWAGGMFMKTAAPSFSLVPGKAVVDGTLLTLSSEKDAEIRYTADGSDPKVNGTLYTVPLALSSTTTIRAVASHDGLLRSEVTEGTFPVKAVPPVLGTAGGTHSAPFDLSITTATKNGEIWYTTDGSEPSPENGTKYVSPIHVQYPLDIKVKTYKEGLLPSDTVSASYTFDRQDGNFEISGPVYHTIAIKDGKGAELSAKVDLSVTDSLMATVSPAASGVTYEWYVNGAPVAGVTGSTVTIGTDPAKNIVVERGAFLITVKASWNGYSVTENRIITFN